MNVDAVTGIAVSVPCFVAAAALALSSQRRVRAAYPLQRLPLLRATPLERRRGPVRAHNGLATTLNCFALMFMAGTLDQHGYGAGLVWAVAAASAVASCVFAPRWMHNRRLRRASSHPTA